MPTKTEGLNAEPIKVLLVEDNEGYSYFVKDVLLRRNRESFTLEAVSRLDAGLDVLSHGDIDIVLLDLGLPDSAGYETFACTRRKSPATPIIILTVLDDNELVMKSMRCGAQDYLLKDDLDPSLMVRAIRYAMERARTEQKLRELSGRLLQLQDEERRRVARDLHETVAQTLAALSMNLSLLEDACSVAHVERSMELLARCRELTNQCSSEVRTTSYLLHPPLLDELGLIGAVRDYADGFARRSGIRVDLELTKDLDRLPKEIETALFRVMQESLVNIHRHSGSKTASISLDKSRGWVTLVIEDSGSGLPEGVVVDESGASRMGVGIPGMRERVIQLGGEFEIMSREVGTKISASLPVRM